MTKIIKWINQRINIYGVIIYLLLAIVTYLQAPPMDVFQTLLTGLALSYVVINICKYIERIKQMTKDNELQIENSVIKERDRCIKIINEMPDEVIVFWDRPGGPLGNGTRPTTKDDLINAICNKDKS